MIFDLEIFLFVARWVFLAFTILEILTDPTQLPFNLHVQIFVGNELYREMG
jgi:hypothetical protein